MNSRNKFELYLYGGLYFRWDTVDAETDYSKINTYRVDSIRAQIQILRQLIDGERLESSIFVISFHRQMVIALQKKQLKIKKRSESSKTDGKHRFPLGQNQYVNVGEKFLRVELKIVVQFLRANQSS